MEYEATLTINGVQEAKVFGEDKEEVMQEIMHYASVYLQDDYQSFEVKFRTKKVK